MEERSDNVRGSEPIIIFPEEKDEALAFVINYLENIKNGRIIMDKELEVIKEAIYFLRK